MYLNYNPTGCNNVKEYGVNVPYLFSIGKIMEILFFKLKEMQNRTFDAQDFDSSPI